MYKACSRCGKIHRYNKTCYVNKVYQGGNERELRSTYKWTLKSLEIRDKAHYLCEVCKDQNILNYDDLEVHHIEKVKDNSDLLLENDNLICLCQFHHKQADAGELDKEYLKSLVRIREGE